VIYREHVEDYRALISEIKSAPSQVSFTSDIWSDPNLTSFLAITCHFCQRNNIGVLEVVNRVLAFRLVTGSHDGDNIGQIMYDIIKEANAHTLLSRELLSPSANNYTSNWAAGFRQDAQKCSDQVLLQGELGIHVTLMPQFTGHPPSGPLSPVAQHPLPYHFHLVRVHGYYSSYTCILVLSWL